MKLLIIGDSFAADWTVKYPKQKGWPNLLAEQESVVNIAKAGVSEYKIYQQVKSVQDIAYYDFFIVAHTSPYRSVTRQHPVHHRDLLHNSADLLLSDIDYHCHTVKGLINPAVRSAQTYFKYHYDIEYHEETYKLFRSTINQLLPANRTITLGCFPLLPGTSAEPNLIDIMDIQTKYPGLINHLSDTGNAIVHKLIMSKINECSR